MLEINEQKSKDQLYNEYLANIEQEYEIQKAKDLVKKDEQTIKENNA